MTIIDNWIDRTVQRLGYIKAQSDNGRASIWAGEAPLGATVEDWSDWSDEQRERLAVTSAWVYSDIKGIANEGSQAGVGIYERKGEELEEVVSHEFEAIMRRPNDFMGGAWLRQYTLWWWLLRGEAYWLKVFDVGGSLREIWPLPASRMRPIPDPVMYISGYGYRGRQGEPEQRLEVEQVCFFRFPNPFDYHRGLSPMSAYRLAMETDVSAARWNREFFNNGAALQMILSVPQMVQSQFEQVKLDINQQLLDQQRRFLVARAGDIKAEAVTVTQKDAEFLAGRVFSQQEIDRIFGYPAGYWSDKANRANAEAAKATLIDQAVWPLLVMMHDEITAQIVQPAYGKQFVAQFADIRVRNRDLELKERGLYFQAQTLDEVRAELGRDPFPDVELGQTLFPLAVKGGGDSGFAAMPAMGTGQMKSDSTGRADLRKWQGIALRRLKSGDPPGYDFESDAIEEHVRTHINEALDTASTAEEVKAAFGGPFRNTELDWESYP